MVGGNFRMDPLQAALLSVKLPHLETYSRKRRENAAYYNSRLQDLDGVMASGAPCASCVHASALCAPPKRKASLLLPEPHSDRDHIWNQYTIRVAPGERWDRPETPRDALKGFLDSRGIGSAIYYPVPMHLQNCFSALDPASLPVCEELSRQCLSLPVFPEITAEEKDAVIDTLREFLKTTE
jgi:dTDP-4-amino-4,6-dideoxygalactose transaminase